jgi:uncharacterized coiled-coil DUF342 family protein
MTDTDIVEPRRRRMMEAENKEWREECQRLRAHVASLEAEVAAQRAKRETTMNEAMRLCEATFHERITRLTQELDESRVRVVQACDEREELRADRDALRERRDKLNKLICNIQVASAAYLPGEISAQQFINVVLYNTDGPEQREAQAPLPAITEQQT